MAEFSNTARHRSSLLRRASSAILRSVVASQCSVMSIDAPMN